MNSKGRRFVSVVAFASLLMFSLLAGGREKLADLIDSNKQAILLLQKSLEAYGGAEAENNLKLSLTVRSNFVNEGQSLKPVAPFENYPMQFDLRMDSSSRRIFTRTSSSIAGDFVFTDQTFLENGKGFSLNPHLKSYRETANEPWFTRLAFPHRTVLQALQNRASLRMIDDSTVSCSTSSGQVITLFIDPKTHLVSKTMQIVSMGVNGDGVRELEFSQYKQAGTLMIPTTLIQRNHNQVHGLVQNQHNFEVNESDFDFKKEEFEVPESFSKEDYSYRKSFGIQNLAKNVYLLENISGETGQWSYNVMIVGFDQFVVVAEAPVNSGVSESVLQKVRELEPGKPVRYLIQSHHHSDHLGGIRSYIAEGTTILTGSESVPLIEKIAAASFRLNPDRLFKNQKKPIIEPVNEKRVIQDTNRELVIYDIGPSPHSTQMMIAYLPAEKILYQSDMINEGEYPENETTRHFYKKLNELGLKPVTIAGLHGKTRKF